MTTPTPSQPPLSAGAVPELPIVAWQGEEFAHSFISETARVGNIGADWIKFYTIALTLYAPAQATIHAQAAEIERLKRERDEALGAAVSECDAGDEARAEVIALKAKQVAEVDEAMRLADAYAEAVSEVNLADGETWHSESKVKRDVAREALRAYLHR